MNSLESDMHSQDQETPLATESEISHAILIRLALSNGDASTMADALAKILYPYGIATQDIWDGLRMPSEDNEPDGMRLAKGEA